MCRPSRSRPRPAEMSWSFREAPLLVAGPCVVEEGDILPRTAEALAAIGARLGLAVCFKASFDKANRAGPGAARGPGLERGLAALARVKQVSGLPVLTDAGIKVDQRRDAAGNQVRHAGDDDTSVAVADEYDLA